MTANLPVFRIGDTITTADALDTLPMWSVVTEQAGHGWVRARNGWVCECGDEMEAAFIIEDVGTPGVTVTALPHLGSGANRQADGRRGAAITGLYGAETVCAQPPGHLRPGEQHKTTDGIWRPATPPAPTVPDRDTIDRALAEVLWNASNHPSPVAVLGKSIDPLRTKCVDAVMAVLADRLTVVEARAQALTEVARDWAGATGRIRTPGSGGDFDPVDALRARAARERGDR